MSEISDLSDFVVPRQPMEPEIKQTIGKKLSYFNGKYIEELKDENLTIR